MTITQQPTIHFDAPALPVVGNEFFVSLPAGVEDAIEFDQRAHEDEIADFVWNAYFEDADERDAYMDPSECAVGEREEISDEFGVFWRY